MLLSGRARGAIWIGKSEACGGAPEERVEDTMALVTGKGQTCRIAGEAGTVGPANAAHINKKNTQPDPLMAGSGYG